MKKLYFQLFAFPFLFLFLIFSYIFIANYIVRSRNFKINETDSNTLTMTENKHYDLLLTGASHARNFSRHMNHYRIESILNKTIGNIAQGVGSCGVEEQFFYLQYFYRKGNSVDKLVYILSTPLLYSESLPIASNTFNQECFDLDFFFFYTQFESENKTQRLFEYFRSKLTLQWLLFKPENDTAMVDELEKIDPVAVKNGIAVYYDAEKSVKRFEKSCSLIEKEIVYAKNHNTEVVFIMPPAVFGKWPGQERTLDFAKRMNQKYGISYYDFSETIQDPSLYYDHHHLNTKGVVFFTKKFLKPVF